MWQNIIDGFTGIRNYWCTVGVMNTYMGEQIIFTLEFAIAMGTGELLTLSVGFSMTYQILGPYKDLFTIFTLESASALRFWLFLVFMLKHIIEIKIKWWKYVSMQVLRPTCMSLCFTKLFGHMKRALQCSHCWATRRCSFQQSLTKCCCSNSLLTYCFVQSLQVNGSGTSLWCSFWCCSRSFRRLKNIWQSSHLYSGFTTMSHSSSGSLSESNMSISLPSLSMAL